MCPSAVERIALLGVGDAGFQRWWATYDVPWKRPRPDAPAKLPACILGSWVRHNGQNALLEKLKRMMSLCTKPEAQKKYVRTLEFLQALENG